MVFILSLVSKKN
jgi:DNA-binding HxlR family transcriptional regulator